jgi:hypothetical protein
MHKGGNIMRPLRKTIVILAISICLLFATTPAFSQWHPQPKSQVDDQRFVPETPQQQIYKANEDAQRYQQVPPPGESTAKKKAKPAKPAPPSTP